MNRLITRTHTICTLLMLTLAFVLAGCDQQASNPQQNAAGASNTPAAEGAIPVGVYASLTGAQATWGVAIDNGVAMAVAERNEAGGINGRPIRTIVLDSKGQSQDADSVVKRLITREEVVAILGEVASSLSLAGGQVAQQYGVPMITPASTNPAVTQIGDMIFRVCFIDPFQGQVVANFAHNNLKAQKVAVLFDQGQAYSVGLKDEFVKSFTAAGGTITTEQAYSSGDMDFKAQLTTIRQTEPDAIFVPGYYTDVGNIALQKKDLGITVPMLGGDGWDSPKLLEIAGDAVEGCYYSNHFSIEDTRPVVQEFVKKYQSRFDMAPDAMSTLGYDAANLLFDAMERAESLSGKDLAKAIAQTKDFPGVTGVITIDPQRNASKSAVILQIKDGVPVFVTNVDPAE